MRLGLNFESKYPKTPLNGDAAQKALGPGPSVAKPKGLRAGWGFGGGRNQSTLPPSRVHGERCKLPQLGLGGGEAPAAKSLNAF